MKKNKSKTSGAATCKQAVAPGGKLARRAANPLALEQRFMFDGAAVAEASHVASMPVADASAATADATPVAPVDASVDVAVPAAVEIEVAGSSGAPSDDAAAGEGGLFKVELPAAEAPASLDAACGQARQSIAETLQRADASETLASLFDAGGASQADAQAFIDSFQRGDENVDVELRSGAELYGAYGAFAAVGADGAPVIYLNAEWIAAGATQDMIEGVLVEEYGHYIDYRLNGAVDTAGDEGEAFARNVLGLGADAERIGDENDHLNILIDGARVEVEMASLMFDNVWTTQGTYDLESNSLVVGPQLTGDRFLFQSTNPLDVWFSGNNVQGTLYAINEFNEVVSATFGEISRLVKTGNTLDAMQMYVYPGGVVDSRNPSQALLIGVRSVFNPLAGSSIGTSSDPVAAALNALLPANVAPAAANDADTAAMPNCATATGEVPATGNVLDNDTDGNITYSIDTGVTPNRLVETMDTLSVTGVVSVATGAVPPTGAITLANPGVVGGAYGVLTLQSDGTYSYNVSETNPTLIALTASQSVTDAFTYTVTDGKGGVSRATLTITISGGNEAPVAVADYEYVEEGSAGPQASGNVLDNDTDADAGDTFTVARASAGDTLSLTPTTVAAGSVTVDAAVRATYGSLTLGSASAVVGQAVTGTGVPANTVVDTVSVKTVTLKNSITGAKVYLDIPIPGTTTLTFGSTAETIASVADPSLRLLFVNSTSVTLGMSVAGIGAGVTEGVAPSTTVVSRTAAGTGSYVLLNQDVTIGAGTSAAADTDLDRNDLLRFTADATVIEGSFGYLKLQSDGSYEYFLTANVPDGAITVENFTYEIEDAAGCTDTAVLRIEIQGAQIQPPAAVADTATASEAGGFNNGSGGSNPSELVVVSGLLGDDVHPSALFQEITNVWASSTATTPEPVASGSSATLDFASVAGTYGVLNVGADGTYEYTLNNSDPVVQALRTAGETLIETFYYEVTDSNGESDVTTLTITITGANDNPVATQDIGFALETSGLANTVAGSGASGNVLDNDTDVDGGDTRTVTLVYRNPVFPVSVTAGTPGVVTGLYGTLTLNDDGTYSYAVDDSNPDVEALASGQTLTDAFTYFIEDTDGATSSAQLQIVIQGANDVLTVDNVFVNEGSPFAIFTVNGGAGQTVSLALTAGDPGNSTTAATDGASAGAGVDYLTGFEVWNGTNWVTYDPLNLPTLDAGGQLLVRVDLENDTLPEGNEGFSLTATTTDGNAVTAAGIINDEGQGSYFAADNTSGVSSVPAGVLLDDDRAMTVSNVTVNEGSPFAVFTVTGAAGQQVLLSLADATGAVLGDADLERDYDADPLTADTLPVIQYFDGTNWVDYDATNPPAIDLAATTLLVRVSIGGEQETDADGPETFSLVATTTGGVANDLTDPTQAGLATIVDDGTGDYYDTTNTTGVSSVPAGVLLDDDRAMTVSNVTVNEGSPFAVFTVTGASGQQVLLSLADATGAVLGDADLERDYDADPLTADTLPVIQYFDGTNWVDYDATNPPAIDLAATTLLVRVSIGGEQETDADGPETFSLVATTTGGVTNDTTNPLLSGLATIVDDGTGDYYDTTNTTGVSAVPAGVLLDDDRAMTVSNVTVNEGSPFAVFTVTGASGQQVLLSLADATGAVLGDADLERDYDADPLTADTLPVIQYFDGTNWVDYDATNPPAIDLAATTLLVRVSISGEQETDADGPETFSLVATTTGGVANDTTNPLLAGLSTIVDDGTGDYYDTTNTTGVSSVPAGVLLDDDRAMTVSNVTVNEGSPFAVFTVTGQAGQLAELSLAGQNGDGANLATLSYWDGAAWQPYVPGTTGAVPLDANGQLLVRVEMGPEQETDLDGPETFRLVATNTGGTPSAPTDGVGTIQDDGTGTYFPDVAPLVDPGTALLRPAVDATAVLDDDRAISVAGGDYNEGSPRAVFTVRANPGQLLSFGVVDAALDATPATTGLAGAPLYYSLDGGLSWAAYTGAPVAAGAVPVLVAVDISGESDARFEGREALSLVVNPGRVTEARGQSTISDDGTGIVTAPIDVGTVNYAGADTGARKDDDRLTPPPPPPPAPAPVAPPPIPFSYTEADRPPITPFDSTVISSPIMDSLVTGDSPVASSLNDQRSFGDGDYDGVYGDLYTSGDGYRVVVIEAPEPRLSVYNSMADQFAEQGASSSFAVPYDAFAHTDANAEIRLEAKLANGDDLPDWVRFDEESGTFYFTAPPGFVGELRIKLTARDGKSQEVSILFRFHVGKEKPTAAGRAGLSDQLRLASRKALAQLDVIRAPAARGIARAG